MSDLPTGTIIFLLTEIKSSTRLWQQQPEAIPAARPRRGGPGPRRSAP